MGCCLGRSSKRASDGSCEAVDPTAACSAEAMDPTAVSPCGCRSFTNPMLDERLSVGDRLSAAVARASARSSRGSATSERAQRLLDDNHLLCMTTSSTTNHPDLEWRGRGWRDKRRRAKREAVSAPQPQPQPQPEPEPEPEPSSPKPGRSSAQSPVREEVHYAGALRIRLPTSAEWEPSTGSKPAVRGMAARLADEKSPGAWLCRG